MSPTVCLLVYLPFQMVVLEVESYTLGICPRHQHRDSNNVIMEQIRVIASCRVLAVMMAAGNAVAARPFVQATGKCDLDRHVLKLDVLGLSLGRNKGGADDKGSP